MPAALIDGMVKKKIKDDHIEIPRRIKIGKILSRN